MHYTNYKESKHENGILFGRFTITLKLILPLSVKLYYISLCMEGNQHKECTK